MAFDIFMPAVQASSGILEFDLPLASVSFLPQASLNKKQRSKLFGFNNLMMLLGNGILNYQGLPGQSLIALSNYLGLEHNLSLSSLTTAWDKFFLRDLNTGKAIERWDLDRLGLGQQWQLRKDKILPLLRNTGLLAAQYPRHNKYDTLIIHGTRAEDIQPRLKFIAEFWQHGGRFNKIVVLTGERKLTADELDQKFCDQNIATEIELMRHVWQTSEIIAAEIKELPICWISTPNFRDKDGQIRRAITEDTINAWLDTESAVNIDWGRCLVVANAPLILRQHIVFERVLYEKGIICDLETVGLAEAVEGSQLVIYYLREIAGLLFELQLLENRQSI